MTETEMGDYVVQAHARYVPDAGKWQPVLWLRRSRDAPGKSTGQTFNYLPALFESEADAIRYCLTKGRALVNGDVIGLTI